MKKLIVLAPILLLVVLALASCGQSAENLNNKGNEAFANQNYADSLVAYQQAAEESPELAEPYYNAANSHYRQESYDLAQQEIEQALLGEESQEDLDQNSLYNLGNTFFQTEQYEMAIEVYKEALRLKPDDLEAKQNLELALRQLQQQEQQQQEQDQQDQQNQDQQDQNEQDQQNQDQQDQQNQDQQDQQNQDQQDQQNQDQQDQQNQDQQQGQPEEQEQNDQADNQPQQAAGLSEEQARQMLEAAAQGTESLEEALQQMRVFPGAPPMEDW